MFATRHTFVRVAPGQYPDWLVSTIRLLGQPSYSEPTAYKTALLASFAGQAGSIKTLFSGQGADALNGFGVARYIYYCQKYRAIPHYIPRSLERGLLPLQRLPWFGGIRKALRMFLAQDDPYLPDYFLNVLDNYTNWRVLSASFSPAEIHAALDYRSQLEVEYLDSALPDRKSAGGRPAGRRFGHCLLQPPVGAGFWPADGLSVPGRPDGESQFQLLPASAFCRMGAPSR